ncbi:MAG: hypothetical protein ABWY81_11015 [Jiangellaceae bacterium]
MTANAYEQAVIAAARNDRDLSPGLAAAVAALDEYEKADSLGLLLTWLEARKRRGDPLIGRAYYALRRAIADSGRGGMLWPERITTAEQFGAAESWMVEGVRNAGPKTYAIWAAGLRAIGIEPAWARELHV